jgi:hypothetical protein
MFEYQNLKEYTYFYFLEYFKHMDHFLWIYQSSPKKLKGFYEHLIRIKDF